MATWAAYFRKSLKTPLYTLAFLVLGSASAFANQHHFYCSAAPQTFQLCRDGNNCPKNVDPQDAITIEGITPGATISINTTYTGAVPGDVHFQAQGQTADFSPTTHHYTVSGETYFTGTITATSTGTEDIHVQIENTPGTSGIQQLSYTVNCNPGPTTGSVTIKKTAIGSNGTFNFSSTLGTIPALTTTGGIASYTFPSVTPGTYTVTEAVPAGWNLTGLTCTGGATAATITMPMATIPVAAGDNITCEYTNEVVTSGSITISKAIIGGLDATSFNFTTTGAGLPASFNLAPASGAPASQTFASLAAGPYTITETALANWSLNSLVCTGGSAVTAGSTATINLVAGQNVICTYTNKFSSPVGGTGTIKIVKSAINANGTFGFTSSANFGATSFSLTTAGSATGGTASRDFASLAPDTYTIQESSMPAGWNFTGLSCSVIGTGTAVISGSGATITLKAGDNIVCTFTNTGTTAPTASTITIVKRTLDGRDGTFSFTSTIPGASSFILATHGTIAVAKYANLANGQYTISEAGMGPGWSLSSLSCTDSGALINVSARSATVTIAGGVGVTCTFINAFNESRIRNDTSNTIRNFMNRRADIIVSEEPDRNRMIRRLAGSLWGDTGGDAAPFSFSGSSSGSSSGLSSSGSYASVPESSSGQMKFSTSMNQIMQAAAHENRDAVTKTGRGKPAQYDFNSDLDVWLEAHYGYAKENRLGYDRAGNYGIIYGGADYLLGSNVLVGALVQIDSMTDNWKTTGASVKGTGWMTGPYATVRLSENLFLDGRLAWGESSNKVNPYGVYEDRFDTRRGLARVNLTGNWVFNNFRITPSVALTYFNEHQLAYTDSLGVYIPSQSVSLGRVTFGPEFGYRFSPSPYWSIEPHIAMMGLWDFQKDGTMTIQDVTVGVQPIRARLQGGVMMRNTDNLSMRWTASYDGIGDRSLNIYGTQLWLNVPLRAANNVRWPAKATPVKWTGAYGGIQFGASQANFRNDFMFGGDEAPGAQGGSADNRLQAIAGIFAGYNYRWDKVVAGVEADVAFRQFSATNERLLLAIPGDNDDRFFVTNKLGTTGSLRARLGYAWNKSLLYGTAGIVLGRVQTDIRPDGGHDIDLPAAIYSQSSVRIGWTAGAGVEHTIADNWFVRGEFRYSQFGAKSFSLNDPALVPEHGPNTNNNSVSLTQGLFGIGYRF